MNTLKKSWMNFTHSSLLYQTITKNELGYFQVNSEILETRISSSSKFVPQKNLSIQNHCQEPLKQTNKHMEIKPNSPVLIRVSGN